MRWSLLTVFFITSLTFSDPITTHVSRATLDNGLRVIVVQDPLAPVVTVEQNYLVGGDETPRGFPGMAHAQEHMAFRGCKGVTGDQIAAIYAQLGGVSNADTQQNITQYFVTVPKEDLDVALQVDAACMAGIDDSQQEWAKERGAIEQEVARDLGNATYQFLTQLNKSMFAGTPYEHDPLGTKASFDATTGAMLHQFYQEWYAPNNAVLVISGNVNGDAAIAEVRDIYGKIPKRTLPPRPQVHLQPVKPGSFTFTSNLPYQLVFLAYRFPGTDDKDYAAARVLADVLSSQRGDIFALVPQGKALEAEFALGETYPKASAAFGLAAIPAGADPAATLKDLKAAIAGYVKNGIPPDLVDAARRSEVASAAFEENSIPGVASTWSRVVAAEGHTDPQEDLDAIERVTVEDVNRLAKARLVDQNLITAILKPAPSGAVEPSKGFGGAETLTSAPTKPVELPTWAETAVKTLAIPEETLHPADITLSNGIRLIVATEHITPTVTVVGEVRHDNYLEAPHRKEGIADVLSGMFGYGTKTLDRLAFQKALDDIAASESSGYTFSLKVLKKYLPRGMALLADDELHPALAEQTFKIVKQQTAEYVAGNIKSPEYREQRALRAALVPKGDPTLRETTPATVADVSYPDVQNYFAKTFRPDLTTIVMIGDITPEEAKAEVEKTFGNWAADGPKPDVTLPAVPANKAAAAYVPDPTQLQDSVILAEELGLNRYDPDYYALSLGDAVLGGGFYATRLYHALRQVTGYVYNVNNSLSATKTRTVYAISYGSDPQNVSKAAGLAVRDLSTMQNEDVSAAELQQAKALLLRQIPLSDSSVDEIAQGLLARAELDLMLDEPYRAAKRYFTMTADEVRAAYKKWIRPADLVQVVRGPQPK